MKSLDNKIALVTGASRGIGRAAAKALAGAGAHVILVARTVGGLEEVDDEISKDGGSATLVPLDVRDFPALDRLGATIFERWGRLDAFLGNAGSLGVHTKTGFKMIGTHPNVGLKFGRWLDIVMMQLALGEGASTVPRNGS